MMFSDVVGHPQAFLPLLALLILLVVIGGVLSIHIFSFSYKRELKKLMKIVEGLREAVEKYQAIVKFKEVTNSEEEALKLPRQGLVTKAKAFVTLTFNVKDVFTPKIVLASTKPIAVYESRP